LSRAAADRDRARERVAQLDVDLRKRRIEAIDLAGIERTTRAKLAETPPATLRASAGQAEAFREKEHREQLAAELGAKAAADRATRARVRDELDAPRSRGQEKQARGHP